MPGRDMEMKSPHTHSTCAVDVGAGVMFTADTFLGTCGPHRKRCPAVQSFSDGSSSSLLWRLPVRLCRSLLGHSCRCFPQRSSRTPAIRRLCASYRSNTLYILKFNNVQLMTFYSSSAIRATFKEEFLFYAGFLLSFRFFPRAYCAHKNKVWRAKMVPPSFNLIFATQFPSLA
jgi:hypothetical protein